MKNEISELLHAISKEEFEKFGDFIKSPYFNKLPRLIKLYDYINGQFSSTEIDSITRESISKYMYPNEEFKNESIRKLLSDFARMLENFLAQEEFEQNEWDKKIYILRGLRTRRYDDKFFKRLKEFKTEHKNSTQEIDEFYETNTKLTSQEYDYYFNTNFALNNEINQKKSDGLDFEFIAKKLFLFQYMLSREYVNKDLKFRYDFADEIMKYFEMNSKTLKAEHPILFYTYLGVILVFNGFQETDLIEMKNFLDDKKFYKRKISKPYWDFINYCTVFTNNNKIKYFGDIFFYLKLLDDNNLILDKSELIHYHFKIALEAALRNCEFDWLENFINKHGNKIKHDFKKDMINLSYAKLYLAKNELSKSKEFAGKVGFKDYLHYISSKQILLKIAYEEEDFNLIISIIDTIKKYFYSHDEIPEVYRAGTEEFIDYILKLSKIKENSLLGKEVGFELDEFKLDLKKVLQEVSFSDWLLEKALEFK